MILEIEDWYLGYSQILKDCRPVHLEEGLVHIYCNADADGLAAARILTFMLRNDGIRYQLLPCRSYQQLKQHVQTISGTNNTVRAVILLNLGATRNLTKLFTTSSVTDEAISNSDNPTEQGPMLDPEATKIFVIDCRRPVHLANVHASNNVVVFWDVQNADDVPSDGDNLSGNESSDDSESSSSDEASDDEDNDSMDEAENQFVDDDDHQSHIYNDYMAEDLENNDDSPSLHENPASDDSESDENHSTPNRKGSSFGKRNKNRRQTMETVANSLDSPSTSHEGNADGSKNDSNDLVEEGSFQSPMTPSSFAPDPTQTNNVDQPLTQRELFENRRNRIRAYYNEGKFYGSPASYVLYKIATELRFGDTTNSSSSSTDILWLACVGITDSYLHARLDVSGYSALALQLRTHVYKLFPNDDFDRVASTVYAEQLLFSGVTTNPNHALTRIGFSENGKILTESDFRFFLLRHSSLYDSMVYSDYISSKFQLSTAKGLHKLHEMLAKMGFPLTECQQPFAFMKPKLKRQLHSKLIQHAEEYGLQANFEYTSFFRITGYQSLLSASDASYAITALLEYDSPNASLENDNGDAGSENDRMIQAFNIAFDALNVNAHNTFSGNDASTAGSDNMGNLVNGGTLSGSRGLAAGIRMAMAQQKCIMTTAFNLINNSAITRLSHFRYAYITCTTQAGGVNKIGAGTNDLSGTSHEERAMDHIFSKPLTLTRLAHYLMDIHRENGKWVGSKARPLILLAEKPSTQSYVVVGFEYPDSSGDVLKNRFGSNFELASQSMKGTFLFDSFDSNVVEVARNDVQRFIEQLHYLMETLVKSNE